ncbi:MAG TPA: hypothetical protein VM095_07840 [Pyrinomonadaceae bacterium]|nr:hypothetical protein [Pyrinomonadaceae bacterium]
MKKLLALTLTLASLGIGASSAEAKVSASSISESSVVVTNAPQREWQNRDGRWRNRGRWDDRNNGRVRVTTQSRLVRYGRQVFRETYQIRYLPNGRSVARLISRVRVR